MRIRFLLAAPGFGRAHGLHLPHRARPTSPKKEDPKAEPKVELPPDVVPSTFRMFLVTDKRFEPLKDIEGKLLKGPDGKDVPSPKNREGKIHCLVCEYGLNPVVAVYVRADAKTFGADSGLGKLVKGIDALIPKHRAEKLAAFVGFLRLEGGTKTVVVKTKKPDGTEVEEKVEQDLEYPDDEKRDVYAKDIRDLAGALNAPNVPFGLAPEKSKAVTAWKIGDDDITVAVYHRMRIVGKPWVFKDAKQLTDDKITEILNAVEAAISRNK